MPLCNKRRCAALTPKCRAKRRCAALTPKCSAVSYALGGNLATLCEIIRNLCDMIDIIALLMASIQSDLANSEHSKQSVILIEKFLELFNSTYTFDSYPKAIQGWDSSIVAPGAFTTENNGAGAAVDTPNVYIRVYIGGTTINVLNMGQLPDAVEFTTPPHLIGFYGSPSPPGFPLTAAAVGQLVESLLAQIFPGTIMITPTTFPLSWSMLDPGLAPSHIPRAIMSLTNALTVTLPTILEKLREHLVFLERLYHHEFTNGSTATIKIKKGNDTPIGGAETAGQAEFINASS